MSAVTTGIFGIGLHCALGKGFADAAQAYLSNQVNFVKSQRGPFGADGMPMTLSCAIPFQDERDFELRLRTLFAGAAADLLTIDPREPVRLSLVVPRWLADHRIGDSLSSWIVETYPRLFKSVEMLTDGDTLALYEIARGLSDIGEGRASALAVGALDSFMNAELLDILAVADRLYKRGTPHGLIPGEGAVLFMLGTNRDFGSLRPLGTIRSVFNGFEREKLSAPQSIIGRGLAKPLRRAFEAFLPVRFLVDLNGERWRSEDLGFALSGARIPDALLADFETPLGNTGDCGAANGMMMAAFALASRQRDTESADRNKISPPEVAVSIVSTSHREGQRCVAAVEVYGKEH